MLFNSYTFIAFAALVVLLHYMRFPWKVKKLNLLLASYIFYAVWNPPFVLLLWLSTLVDFFAGKKLHAETDAGKRKGWLILSLAVNLGMLAFFKYGTFLLENFVALTSLLGLEFHPADPGIILPVGISFYTFQTLSYTLDMYYRRSQPERSLLDFSLFVTFFPQLVAGPIVRPAALLPQFKSPKQATKEQFVKGLMLLSLGLFMKVVMADTMLSGAADMVFGASEALLTIDAWMGVLAFSGQIFFDFAGYSTCAIGIAMVLGFSLPDNFRFPYAANGFSDFWRRWHITLSEWLRDYVYIPLGGNRNGAARTYINLMITMLLGGLWHGASWTFVVWGGLHGLYLGVERIVKTIRSGQTGNLPLAQKHVITLTNSLIPPVFLTKGFRYFLSVLFTFFLVNITWVFFRATDFSSAWRLLVSMLGMQENSIAILPTLELYKVALVTVVLFFTHYFMKDRSVMEVVSKQKWWVVSLSWTLLLILLVLSQKSSGSFIYFQF